MSVLRFSLAVAGGVLLAALGSQAALAQGGLPPRNSGSGWNNGPAPGGPPGPRGVEGPRRPRAERGDSDGPPGQPPDGDPRRGGPRGEQGDRRGPPDDRGGPDGPDGPDGPGIRGHGGPGGPDGRSPDSPGGQPPGRFGPPMDFESLKTRDPELYKAMQDDRDLERQTRELAAQFSHSGEVKIKEKLAEVVDKHFAVRQQLRTLEVKRLEQQVKQLRDRIEQREKDRKVIVAKRITELIGADDGEHF